MKKILIALLCLTPLVTWTLLPVDGEAETPTYTYNLVDPEQAPPEIRDKVLLGFKLMHQTKEYADEYVGNELNCNNCHFGCGNTFGGKNGSISLVGSPKWYPAYNARFQKEITLKDRIDNCFRRSMNGKPLPHDSKEMEALVAYLTWISSNVEHLKEFPWRGLPRFNLDHTPDPIKGKEIYMKTCATCHMPNGEGMSKKEGTLEIPPIFGPQSYNDGAGMNRLEILSSFVYYNMPFDQPSLTKEEALDVAAYVIEQPRPAFESDQAPVEDKPLH